MALSQKHSGKILTPWFDVAEWNKTKGLIYGDSEKSNELALERLKIWKLRTPLLSAGIEGTLILLEALLTRKKDLTAYEIAQIYSAALLRFLNICASSNDKQGTFYQTAQKNNLPLWLISLRHDIAHDHKVPSKTILESALKECLTWVKEKYWDMQEVNMKDYIVVESNTLKEFISNYIKLKLCIYYKKSTKSLITKIRRKIKRTTDVNEDVSATEIVDCVENFILESDTKDSSIDIVAALMDKQNILSVFCDSVQNSKRIPSDFINLWLKLLTLLYQNGSLFVLINELHDITESNSSDYFKGVASLWIVELYRGLLKTKALKEELEKAGYVNPKRLDLKKTQATLDKLCYNNYSEYANVITFMETDLLPFEASKLFQTKVLENPNQYILTYLELVLRFNGKDNIKEKIDSIKKLVTFNPSFYTDPQKIYTIRDLENLDINFKGENQNVVYDFSDFNEEPKKKFRKLTKAESFSFKGYPLGLMPPIKIPL